MRFLPFRIVKSSGLDDTPENRQELQEWVDRQKEKIANGTFVFAEVFPGAAAKEKVFHAQLEGWDYRPEPQPIDPSHPPQKPVACHITPPHTAIEQTAETHG